jgi:DNA (cytosine-5)-methyltransferase 1
VLPPKYSLVDLFAGPGGLTLGFKESGFFQPIVGVESDPVVAETYQRNLATPVILKKVEEVSPHEIKKLASEKGYDHIDIVVGGPPCRPFTTANTGETRWKIIKEREKYSNHPNWVSFYEIVCALKPLAVVAENVMGFQNSPDVFLTFVTNLLSSGYVADSQELDASHFGVPQKRRRIFIVGIRGLDIDKSLLFPKPKDTPKLVKVREAIGDLPSLSNDKPNCEKPTYERGHPTSFQSLMRDGQTEVQDHTVHAVHPVMAKRFEYIPQGYNLLKALRERRIPADIMKKSYFRGKRIVAFSKKTLKNMHSNIYRRLEWNKPSCTITHVRKTVLIHPLEHRLLSVREAARLQSFPDWYRFSGSINQQYQQIADAVPPLLAKELARHLARIINLHQEPIPIRQSYG